MASSGSEGDGVEAVVPSLPVQAGRAALSPLCCACGEGAAAGGKAAAGRTEEWAATESGSLDRRGAHRTALSDGRVDRIGLESSSPFLERETDGPTRERARERQRGRRGRERERVQTASTHNTLAAAPRSPTHPLPSAASVPRKRRHSHRRGRRRERTDGEGTVKKPIISSIRRRRRRRFDLRRRRSLSRCCGPSGGVASAAASAEESFSPSPVSSVGRRR